MTAAAISAADKSILRISHRHTVDLVLNIIAPQVTATALINGAPTLFPAADLTVDTTVGWDDVEVGQLVKIAASDGTPKTWGVVRKAVIANTLYLDPKSLGEPGYAERIETAIADDDEVTIYSHKPLWGLYSRILNKAFFKEHDLTYVDQNRQPPPVANAGAWQAGDGSDGTASFTLPRKGSNSSYAHGAFSIASYLWTLLSGVSLVAGYATSDAVIEVTATPGQHRIQLTVTDSNGNSHTATTWLFVKGTGYTPFGETYPWQIESFSQTRQGAELVLSVWGDGLDDSVILPGAGVLLTESALFGGQVVSDGVLADTFVGYIVRFDEVEHDGEVPRMSMTVQSPYLIARDIPMPSQLLAEVSGTPGDWTECSTALSNPAGALFYLIRWHCRALLDMHDLDVGALTTPRKLSWPFDAGDLGSQMQSVADQVLGNLGSALDGTTTLRKNPIREGNTYRNAVAEVFDWQPGDIIPPITYPHNFRPQVGQVIGAGRSYNGGGASGIAPYAAIRKLGQGVGRTRMPDFSIALADGLTRVREAVGHWYAEQNNPTPEIRITADRNLDIVDPVQMVWHSFLIPADTTYDPRGKGWNGTRMLPVRVDRRYELEDFDLVKTIDVSFQPETFGQPGEELPWPRGEGAGQIDFGWVHNVPVPFAPKNTSLQLNLLLVHNDGGELARSFSLTSANPIFQDVSSLLEGTVCDADWDYNSAFFTNGFNASFKASVFVVTADGTSLNIYRIDDIFATTLSAELLSTYTMNDSSVSTGARIQCSRDYDDFVAVHWHDQSGEYVGRSTDNGGTWAAAVTVGSGHVDTGNDNADLGFALDGQAQLAAGWNGSSYTLYRAATTGGTFSAVSGASTISRPIPMIIADGEDSAYVVFTTISTTLNTVSMDSTTEPLYTDSQEATLSQVGGVDVAASYSLSGPSGHYLEHTGVAEPSSMALETLWQLKPSGFEENPISDWDSGNGITFRFEKRTTVSTPGQVEWTLPWTILVTFDDDSTDTDSGTLIYNASTATTTGPVGGIYTYFVAVQLETNIDITGGKRIKSIEITTSGTPDATTLQDEATWRILITRPRIDITETIYAGALKRVDDVHTSPTWWTITPSTPDGRPDAPYGLGVSKQDVNDIAMVGGDGSADWRLFQSVDQGGTWSNGGVSSYRAVKVSGDILLLGGVAALDYSGDGGSAIEDKRGNLAAVWGDVGTIRGMLALV